MPKYSKETYIKPKKGKRQPFLKQILFPKHSIEQKDERIGVNSTNCQDLTLPNDHWMDSFDKIKYKSPLREKNVCKKFIRVSYNRDSSIDESFTRFSKSARQFQNTSITEAHSTPIANKTSNSASQESQQAKNRFLNKENESKNVYLYSTDESIIAQLSLERTENISILLAAHESNSWTNVKSFNGYTNRKFVDGSKLLDTSNSKEVKEIDDGTNKGSFISPNGCQSIVEHDLNTTRNASQVCQSQINQNILLLENNMNRLAKKSFKTHPKQVRVLLKRLKRTNEFPCDKNSNNEVIEKQLASYNSTSLENLLNKDDCETVSLSTTTDSFISPVRNDNSSELVQYPMYEITEKKNISKKLFSKTNNQSRIKTKITTKKIHKKFMCVRVRLKKLKKMSHTHIGNTFLFNNSSNNSERLCKSFVKKKCSNYINYSNRKKFDTMERESINMISVNSNFCSKKNDNLKQTDAIYDTNQYEAMDNYFRKDVELNHAHSTKKSKNTSETSNKNTDVTQSQQNQKLTSTETVNNNSFDIKRLSNVSIRRGRRGTYDFNPEKSTSVKLSKTTYLVKEQNVTFKRDKSFNAKNFVEKGNKAASRIKYDVPALKNNEINFKNPITKEVRVKIKKLKDYDKNTVQNKLYSSSPRNKDNSFNRIEFLNRKNDILSNLANISNEKKDKRSKTLGNSTVKISLENSSNRLTNSKISDESTKHTTFGKDVNEPIVNTSLVLTSGKWRRSLSGWRKNSSVFIAEKNYLDFSKTIINENSKLANNKNCSGTINGSFTQERRASSHIITGTRHTNPQNVQRYTLKLPKTIAEDVLFEDEDVTYNQSVILGPTDEESLKLTNSSLHDSSVVNKHIPAVHAKSNIQETEKHIESFNDPLHQRKQNSVQIYRQSSLQERQSIFFFDKSQEILPIVEKTGYQHLTDLTQLILQNSIRPELTSKEIVLRLCEQSELLSFTSVYSKCILNQCRKIGEGLYGEVFISKNIKNEDIVLKIIPIQGSVEVNGEPQKSFEQTLSEIEIAIELSNLRKYKDYMTSSFVEVKKVSCVQGRYPDFLIDLWELYRDNFGTENDHPEIFPDDQIYIVFELTNGGQDLEAFTFQNALQSYSAFVQTALALAVAEQKFKFEHRDLHWGNILLAPTTESDILYKLNGKTIKVASHGIKATIIDYTLSRMVLKGRCIYNDLSNDIELFEATGDYQFDIYRLMKKHISNDWSAYEPYTNILWLHYLIDKMINGARYSFSKSKKHRSAIHTMMLLRDELLEFKSAYDYSECLK